MTKMGSTPGSLLTPNRPPGSEFLALSPGPSALPLPVLPGICTAALTSMPGDPRSHDHR